MKRFFASFGYAFRGLAETIMRERNMRVHICFCVFVTFFGFVCGIEAYEWLAAVILMGLVISAEAHNTATERTLDRVGTEQNEQTRRAKDAAAGGVLAAAIFAAVGGGIIFFRKARIDAALGFFNAYPWAIALVAAALVGAALFVALPGRHRKEN
ncbi:MAG: diacylglycerol kinase family protein [Clostridia bacterium]|nr:diacylglycerol kinase family protein [Clostridia bacterium]